MKTDRLRTLSFAIAAIGFLALFYEATSRDGHFVLFGITLVLLLTVLENVRREFRDLRAEIEKRSAPSEVPPHENI